MEKVNSVYLVSGIWLLLFFVFLPFPTSVLPEVGTELTQLLLPLTKSLSGIPETTLSKTHSFSDSTHLFLQTLILGMIATVISWLIVRKNKMTATLPWIRLGVVFILSFFLLKYGLEKWTRMQFPQPPPNILHATTGSLEKDILFWTMMGTSKTYSWFMGFVEILAAVLLFFRRTRYLGAYVACGVFLNVFAINIGFNITVKLLSFVLLLSALYIIGPTLRPVFQFLSGKQIERTISPDTVKPTPVFKRFFKGLVVVLIFLECTLPLFDHPTINRSNAPLNHQSFEIIESNNDLELSGGQQFKQLHFHPQGYLVTESYDGSFDSHPIRLPDGAMHFTLLGENLKITVRNEDQNWIFLQGNEPLWRCRKIDNQSLPLLRDDFNWTVESMLPE